MLFSSIQECFAERVRLAPDAVAVVAGDERITYRDLEVRTDHFAQRLIEQGLKPHDPVAVLMAE